VVFHNYFICNKWLRFLGEVLYCPAPLTETYAKKTMRSKVSILIGALLAMLVRGGVAAYADYNQNNQRGIKHALTILTG